MLRPQSQRIALVFMRPRPLLEFSHERSTPHSHPEAPLVTVHPANDVRVDDRIGLLAGLSIELDSAAESRH